MPKNIRKTFYLPSKVVQWLEKNARETGRSTSNALAMILKEVSKLK